MSKAVEMKNLSCENVIIECEANLGLIISSSIHFPILTFSHSHILTFSIVNTEAAPLYPKMEQRSCGSILINSFSD